MSNRKDHLIVFMLTTSLFIIGVFAGVMISQSNMNEIEIRVNSFEDSIKTLEIGFLINDALNNQSLSCSFLQAKINETQTQLVELGDRASDYEENAKIRDSEYSTLKTQYNTVRAEYWLMLEKLKRQCNDNYTTILYFYRTNTPCPDCRDQGVILTHLSTIRPDVYVVPLDADEDLLIVNTIKDAYSVSETPTLIIDASLKLTGLISENELISLLS